MSERNGSTFGSVFKSLTKSLKPASGRVPVVVNAKVVGGASDLQKLLHQLKEDPLPIRVNAATSITRSLENFSVSSIPEIWYLARDLCGKRFSSSVRRVAVTLMIRCIEHDTLEVGNRLVYYRDIVEFCDVGDSVLDPEYGLFLKALRALTDDGKEIHDLCVYNQGCGWSEFVMRTVDTMEKSSFAEKKENGVILADFAAYLSNCFKFNFAILDEHFVSSLLPAILQLSSLTRNENVLFSICELVRTISVFAFIPADSYVPTILFLCAMAPTNQPLLDASWTTMSGIFSSTPVYALDATVSVFHGSELLGFKGADISHDDLRLKADLRCLLTALGAIALLEKMLLMCGSREVESFDLRYERLNSALDACISLDIPILSSVLLRMLDRLLSMENDEKSFTTLFPFHVWYSSSVSVFSSLTKLRVRTTQDERYWNSLCNSLLERFTSGDLTAPEDRLVALFLLRPDLHDDKITDFTTNCYRRNSLCVISNSSWKENCKVMLSAFYFKKPHSKHSSLVRIRTLELIKDAYDKSLLLSDDDSVGLECILLILQSNVNEDDGVVLNYLSETVVSDFLRKCRLSSFETILDAFGAKFGIQNDGLVSVSKPAIGSPTDMSEIQASDSLVKLSDNDKIPKSTSEKLLCEIAKSLACLFAESMVNSPEKASTLFEFLLKVLNFSVDAEHHKVSLLLIKVFIRLRATSDGLLYLCEPAEMNGMATTFKRNTSDESHAENDNHWWHFPEEVGYLPKEFFNKPNKHILNRFQETDVLESVHDLYSFDFSKWLAIVLKIMKQGIHWEVFSYTLAHLCSQLFNLSLFWHLKDQVFTIQEEVCGQLMLKLHEKLALLLQESDINKSDLQVAHVRMLSSLVGYHDLFDKQEEENMIKALLFGLGSWQKTAIPCIHMLTICCYEISGTLKKYLIPILTKLQTGVTSVFASTSALEFLMAMIHVPSLTSNFTNDEFRQVLAICFRYIEHARNAELRGFKDKESSVEERLLSHGVDAEVDVKASTQSMKLTPLLYQYLLSVSYAVMTRWFLKIDLTERAQISSFVVRNVISCSGAKTVDNLDEMTVAILDAITRFTYSDIPLKIATKSNSVSRGSMCRWIIGHSIIEINTDDKTGATLITLRRPCGVSAFDLNLNPSMLSANMKQDPDKRLIMSSHLLLQLFKPLDQDTISKPVALMDDSYTERAINALDRIPVVSHHKAGVVYIGPGQNDERDILSTRVGSADYHQFLNGLGELVKLNSCDSIYVGGLDKENGTDGEYAYFWSDELTHLIYHVSTMMPNAAGDTFMSMKKRHIGNNYVNVFFDESGLPFNFNLIKSQFNFLNIVISPHTMKSSGSDARGRRFYKVITYRRNGVPGIFATTHFKLSSLEQLPQLVRNMVIMSNFFSDIWHNSVSGSYTSGWQLRVRQIDSLRDKAIQSQSKIGKEQSNGNGSAQANASKNTVISFLEQLQPQRAPNGEEQSSPSAVASKDVTGGEKDLYSLLEFNSYT